MTDTLLYEPRDEQVVVAAAPELRIDPRFTQHMLGWFRHLDPLPLGQAVPDPPRAAVLSTDLIVGFTYEGRLASPRVAALAPKAADLFQRAYRHGVRHLILAQDAHSPTAPEFEAWGPHCVRGTAEAQTIPELAELPFRDHYVLIEKNSLNQGLATQLPAWLAEHPQVRDFIVIGDCTDLCVYQAAMYLRMQANALDIPDRRVIVPADLVDTFDIPLDAAMRMGVMPHPGDFFHLVFLYHMAMNGVQVVRALV
ncbi:MAG: cysteine hydrolase [Anaerolineae bacterium]|nr:cysteine hydrolase [Anaerolineae bacterium]